MNIRPTPPVILILSDNPAQSGRIGDILNKKSYLLLKARNLAVATELTADRSCDLIIVDLQKLPISTSDLLRLIETRTADCLIITENDSLQQAVDIFQNVGCNYILKPYTEEIMQIQVEQMLENRRIRQELNALREDIAWKYCFDRVVGISRVMTNVKTTAARIAATDTPVLISGESGTGKEHLARAIHYHSSRRKNRFLPVDCSVFTPEVLEADLFGDIVTGEGRLTKASGGTVFLDELAELSPGIQERFAQLINASRSAMANRESSEKINIRLIGATGYRPTELPKRKNIIEDFVKRLGLVSVHIPPLRDRMEDIVVLVEHFITMENKAGFREPMSVSAEAMEKLISHPWPGNVRELENTVKRAVTLAQKNRIMASDIIFLDIGRIMTEHPENQPVVPLGEGTLEESLKRRIEATLHATNWNYTKTAGRLGIGRTTLWRKIKKYDIKKAIEN